MIIIKKNVTIYMVLLFTILIMNGYLLNYLGLHMAINKITINGINYDAFREMKVEEQQIEEIKTQLIQADKIDFNKTLDEFTLTMMLYNYDISKDREISQSNCNYLYKKLKDNKSMQEIRNYYNSILLDVSYFPTVLSRYETNDYSFTNTWFGYRSFGGNRRHEGTDIFPKENKRGIYPIVSVSDGVVEKIGWLEQGGYRIGIRGSSGAYYYYAHLDSYAPNLAIGDSVKAGQFLGLMGDSGYGSEGTTGQFDVHLHFGIYVDTPFGEISVNPYWILIYLKSR